MSNFGNLEIGKTGLMAAQLGQTTTGHNIANANTEGYSRQRLEQSADTSKYFGGLHGVRVDRISRLYNQFNAEKVIGEQSKYSDWQARESYMKAVEAVFQDLDGKNLGEAMGNFWNAWSSAASQPESQAERQNLLSVSQDLVDKFKALDKRLDELQTSLNREQQDQMDEVNGFAQQVAELNKQIHQVEAAGNPAGDLKDKRDQAVQSLAEKIDINWFYSREGHLDINLPHGAALVRGVSAYKIQPYYDTINPEFPQVGYEIAPSVLLNLSPFAKAGTLKSIQTVRDTILGGLRSDLNTLAKTLVDSVNDLHSTGHGLTPPYHQLVSAYQVYPEDFTQPLSHIKDGEVKFELQPDSKLQDPIAIVVSIDAGKDSLTQVIEKINAAAAKAQKETQVPNTAGLAKDDVAKNQGLPNPPLVAELSPNNHLQIKAGSGFTFRMGGDTSHLLSRLGFNSFLLMDKGISDLKVNPFLQEDEMRIALGNGVDPGSNEIALGIHDLQFEKVLNNDTVTLDEYYRTMYTNVGRETKQAKDNSQSHKSMFDQYKAMQKGVTGVNIDEEMTNMIKYQKAYEASAKYISTVDQMTESLLKM